MNDSLSFSLKEICEIKEKVYNSYIISSCLFVITNKNNNLIRVSYEDDIEVFIEFRIINNNTLSVNRYLFNDKDIDGLGRKFRATRNSILTILDVWAGYIYRKYMYEKNYLLQNTIFVIKGLSNRFWKIYINGILLEKRGSYEAGMLYRKALEFLFIGYIKYKGYKYDKKITIGSICKDDSIKEYFTNAMHILEFIKEINTSGNDYSHYREEELDFKNITIMRKKIGLFIDYIVSEKKFKENEEAIKKIVTEKTDK